MTKSLHKGGVHSEPLEKTTIITKVFLNLKISLLCLYTHYTKIHKEIIPKSKVENPNKVHFIKRPAK